MKSGNPVAILETNNDISEQKEAEESLRRSQAFLAEGQRISHTGSWSWNVSNGEVTWSEEHFRIFGFDPKKTEPSFQLFLETVHPEDRSFIERSLDEAVREKRGFDMEFRIALADGTVKHVQGVGRPVVNESGEVDRYIGTTVDISERKRGEALFVGEKRLLEMIATGVALKEILNVLCHDYRGVPPRHACFYFVASSRWSSSRFRGGTESSQGMEAANGKAAHWAVCWFLRDSGVSRISSHCFRYCD